MDHGTTSPKTARPRARCHPTPALFPATEHAYVTWITRDIFFHDKRHPKDLGAADIGAFLTHLAVQQKVAASTQNQALSALLFLYRDVLRQPLDRPIEALRARKPKPLPTVLV